jgi:hypothetical protein
MVDELSMNTNMLTQIVAKLVENAGLKMDI